MKNYYLTFILLISTILSFGQTIEREEEYLNKILADQSKSQEEIKILFDNWRAFNKEFGEFPKVPFNPKNDQIEYTFTKSYSNLTKEVIMDRILEWSAINFGALDAVLHYKDEASGKIILKGYFSITHKQDYNNFWGTKKEGTNTKDCYQTYVFTVKDNKMKVQVTNLKLEFTSGGYLMGNTFIPTNTEKFPLFVLYPITRFEPIEWKKNLDILKKVDESINTMIENMDFYIGSYSTDYTY